MIQLPEGFNIFNSKSKVTIDRGLQLYVKSPLTIESCKIITCVQISDTALKFVDTNICNRYWDDICTREQLLNLWLKEINRSSKVLGYKKYETSSSSTRRFTKYL